MVLVSLALWTLQNPGTTKLAAITLGSWKIWPPSTEFAEESVRFGYSTICPLHGPILTDNLAHYLRLYDLWSSYTPETDGIVIAYTPYMVTREKR